VIGDIPFAAATIPMLAGMERQGVNATARWWAPAVDGPLQFRKQAA